MTGRIPRYDFGGSPWARAEVLRDPIGNGVVHELAAQQRVNVSMVGKTARGPWVVTVWNSQRSLRFAGSSLLATAAFGVDRWIAGADDHGIRWTAGADKLAHGHATRSPRTLCKQEAIDERRAHPELRRCQECWRALDGRMKRKAVAA